MQKTLFAFENYKTYLKDAIKSAPKAGHGYRLKLAEAMQIQPTYLSQVLKGDRDLSLDQAILLTDFLQLSKDESEFLILLVNRARAGSVKSAKFFTRQIEERRERYARVRDRVKITRDLTDEDKSIYYSDVSYGAVHMAVTIPELRTLSALEAKLKIEPQRLREIIDFLADKNLIQRNEGKLAPGTAHLFVDKASPHVVAHHRNWHLKALEKAAERREDSTHITLGITVSEADAKLIRQKIARFIEEIAQQIKDSPEEKLMGFCLDFFDY